ncbi:MAG: choice-of-anchor J domain-containing protein [Flavobacteriales bacterium]|nr:choice-of-anchor J domain-containing protein [Flavobacteriales bacterium]
MNLRNVVSALALMVVAVACKKEFDSPPVRTIPVGSVLTIAELKALYTNTAVVFSEPLSVYATVTTDETDGNFYKNITVQDSTGGITLRLLNSGGLYIGDSIRIYLPGTKLEPYNGLMQITELDVDDNIIKQATQRYVRPRETTIPEVLANVVAWQSTLIKLNDVQFIASEAAGGTWSVPSGTSSVDRHLQDCNNNQIIIRNSPYSNYAGQSLPTGNGSIVASVGLFGSTVQLGNQGMATVQMNGARCNGETLPILSKDFEDLSITSGGWTQQNVIGNVPWTTNSIGADKFGQCRNYDSGTMTNQACETWFISPTVDLSGTTAPKLLFRTACNYTGAQLQIKVSTDYVSGDPSTGTWTTLSAPLSTGSWNWVQSGDLDLQPYSGSNFHVAFIYTGSSTDGKTWEVDDIRILAE